MVADGEHVGGDALFAGAGPDDDGGELAIAFGTRDESVRIERDAGDLASVMGGFKNFAGVGEQGEAEAGERRRGRLFHNGADVGTGGAQPGGYGEEEGSGTGDDDALAGNGEAGFDEGLKAACAVDAGEGPVGKRQKEFASAGGKDELVERKIVGVLGVFKAEHARVGSGEDAGAQEDCDVAAGEALQPRMRLKGCGACDGGGAPNLTAGRGIVIDETYAQAMLSGSGGSGQAGGTGAHDEQIAGHSVTTVMPGEQTIWQVR